MNNEEIIRKNVRERYAGLARSKQSCCGPEPSCCGSGKTSKTIARAIGYKEEDLTSVPDGANLGLGCGNPVALASLRPGEIVLDLGSGAGFDCFLAARRVGKTGHVIGVDMTPEMLATARENARKGGCPNVEFRLGEIEHLPVADTSVDVILSNCVINLSPDKLQVFREAFRVLKPSGRLMISDTVLVPPLPEFLQQSVAAYVGCVSGAMQKEEYIRAVEAAGFRKVAIEKETPFSLDCMLNDPMATALIEDLKISRATLEALDGAIQSILLFGEKPIYGEGGGSAPSNLFTPREAPR